MQGSAEQDGAAFEILRRLGSSRNFATALFPSFFRPNQKAALERCLYSTESLNY
jgi:hypothetical protein